MKTQELIAKKQEKQSRAMAGKVPSSVTIDVPTCQSLCKDAGIEYLEGYEGRVLEYTITNETVDRYGDIVRCAGGDVNNYKKNPVINFAHENSFPVGNTIKIWMDEQEKSWKAWGLFMDNRVDKSGRADLVYNMAKSGFMPACSIGFNPKSGGVNYPDKVHREEYGMPDHGVEFKAWELLEWSPCSVQANPDALQNCYKNFNLEVAKEFKLIDTKYIEQIDKFIKEAETTVPVKEPKIPFCENHDKVLLAGMEKFFNQVLKNQIETNEIFLKAFTDLINSKLVTSSKKNARTQEEELRIAQQVIDQMKEFINKEQKNG